MEHKNVFKVSIDCPFCGHSYQLRSITPGEILPEAILQMKCPECEVAIQFPPPIGKPLVTILSTTVGVEKVNSPIGQDEIDKTDFGQLGLDLQKDNN